MSTDNLLTKDELGLLVPIGIKYCQDRQMFLRQLAIAFRGKRCSKECHNQLKLAMMEALAVNHATAKKNLDVIKESQQLEQQQDMIQREYLDNCLDESAQHRLSVIKAKLTALRASNSFKAARKFRSRMLAGITPEDIDNEIKCLGSEDSSERPPALEPISAVDAPAMIPEVEAVNNFLGMHFEAPLQNTPIAFADEPEISTERLLNKTSIKKFIKLQRENEEAASKLSESALVEKFLREARERHAELLRKRKESANRKAEEDNFDEADDLEATKKNKRQKSERDRSVTLPNFGALYFVLFGPMSNHFKFGHCNTIMYDRTRHYTPAEGPLHLVWRVIINAGANSKKVAAMIEGKDKLII